MCYFTVKRFLKQRTVNPQLTVSDFLDQGNLCHCRILIYYYHTLLFDVNKIFRKIFGKQRIVPCSLQQSTQKTLVIFFSFLWPGINTI